MKEFMYIFRGDLNNERAFTSLSPEDMQKELQKWNTWMSDLAEKGKLIGGQPLFAHGKVVKANARKITDGPFTEGKDIVGGYLLIKADDFNEAVELSRGCPSLTTDDGSVEVREIMPAHQG